VIADNIFDGSDEPLGTAGEAITIFAASPIIERNTFTGHSCDPGQGFSSVVWTANDTSAKIRNNVWAGNDCTALLFFGSDSGGFEVINNTFFENRAGIIIEAGAQGAVFANNLLESGGWSGV
jgi:parallel beta-helix repeat protein